MNKLIQKVQIYLNSKGFSLVVDGFLGPKTMSAIGNVIQALAQKNGVEPGLALAVAQCESGLNPYATLYNPPSKSTDRGLYQWNSAYHKEITDEQAFDIEKSTLLFCQAVKSGKLHTYWSASEPLWKNKVNAEILKKYKIKA